MPLPLLKASFLDFYMRSCRTSEIDVLRLSYRHCTCHTSCHYFFKIYMLGLSHKLSSHVLAFVGLLVLGKVISTSFIFINLNIENEISCLLVKLC